MIKNIEPLFLSLRDGFKLIGVGETKGRQLINEGRLKMVKLGRKSLLEVDSLKVFAASLTHAPSYSSGSAHHG